tara:strand:- start:1898 stop:2455 length:558 start_codon:yes stop_codon:yes gene_type:complete
MIWNEIICLGDSITYGARDEYDRSYTSELPSILENITKELWVCHNYGINGETSSNLLRRTWRNISSHHQAKIVCLMIGTNDTKIPMPEEIYEDNLKQIINICKIQGKFVLIGTLPPLSLNPNYRNNLEYIEKYNSIIKKLAKNHKIELAEFDDISEYLIDGVHFGNAGYKKIAEIWSKSILKIQE